MVFYAAYLSQRRHTRGESSNDVFIKGEIFVKNHSKIFNSLWGFKVFTQECKAKFWDFRSHLSTSIYNQLGLLRI